MKKIIILTLSLCLLFSGQLFAGNDDLQSAEPKSKWHLTYDSKYKLKFFGRISADGTFFTGEDYQKLGNGTTISQLCAGGIFSFGDRLEGKFEVDFSNGQVLLLDNFITYKFTQEFGVRTGNIQEAFSMDLLNSFKDLSLMNRAQVVNAFAPGHHLGVQAVFENKQWLLTGGVHFQRSMLIGQRESSDSYNRRGVDEGYSATGRIVWMPQDEQKFKGLHLGVAASYSTPKTDTGKDVDAKTMRFSSSESTINKIKFLDTGIITDVDNNLLLGGEIAGYYGPAKFQAEYIHNTIDRSNNFGKEKFSGFYAQASCLLLGGQQDYNNSRGAFNQPLINKRDVELAARFDRLDMNGDNIKGGAANQYTFGVNYYINENLKLQFNYSYCSYDKFANANGNAAIGYKSDGELAYTLGEADYAKGKPSNDYGSFNFRMQLRF